MIFNKKTAASAADNSCCEAVALPSYGSANSNTDTSIEYNYKDEEQSTQLQCEHAYVSKFTRSLPVIVLIAFAALVSHSLSSDPHAVTSSLQVLPLTTKPTPTDEIAKSVAEEALQTHLLDPSMNSELYHAGNVTAYLEHGGNPYSPPIPPPPEGCDATLIILRHCEAGLAREHCGLIGFQRSDYIATLFGEGGKWPKPSYLIAMAAGERHNIYAHNWREIETLVPLADKFGIDIDTTYGFPEKEALSNMLFARLRSGEMCGKLAVLSWKHHDMSHFAQSMGCRPEDGCPTEFGKYEYDHVWQIKYNYQLEKYAPYVVEDNTEHGMSKKHPWGEYPRWTVYGTVQAEFFDPLEWATKNGIYK